MRPQGVRSAQGPKRHYGSALVVLAVVSGHSASWRGPHERGTARELKPPRERLQPRKPQRVLRVQAASTGRRSPPPLCPHLGAV
ncbi:hypothetical protein NDU88_003371 [Pleurodeles waltl]|uniref:Secreted protein n=1 Tax=Pleurodeles waltl TaxID=8319 RepID=A0AAV7SFD4_PLEWA|nr:hypothetical protein NDU88_003371 [Pleurodeles waltl]